jgi:hypothetical protein
MDINYSRQLVKGKIVEVIFEEMFKQSEEFDIIPIGYEYTIPELAQYQHHVQVQKVLENIRNAPDFALISRDKKQVYLVEVKYRNPIYKQEIFYIANELHNRWTPAFLFIASQDGFYFESCFNIIQNQGDIKQLGNEWVSKDFLYNSHSLLKEFIKA